MEGRPQSPDDSQQVVVAEIHRTEKDQEVLDATEVTEANEVDVPDEDESDSSRRARLSKRINDEAVEDDLVECMAAGKTPSSGTPPTATSSWLRRKRVCGPTRPRR